jgi:hypothetical protein
MSHNVFTLTVTEELAQLILCLIMQELLMKENKLALSCSSPAVPERLLVPYQ